MHKKDHEESDLDNQFHEDSYPMQDTDIEDLPVHMNGILLYWIILILIHVDSPPGHQILLLGTNMIQ